MANGSGSWHATAVTKTKTQQTNQTKNRSSSSNNHNSAQPCQKKMPDQLGQCWNTLQFHRASDSLRVTASRGSVVKNEPAILRAAEKKAKVANDPPAAIRPIADAICLKYWIGLASKLDPFEWR